MNISKKNKPRMLAQSEVAGAEAIVEKRLEFEKPLIRAAGWRKVERSYGRHTQIIASFIK
jgi:hypothetical protein